MSGAAAIAVERLRVRRGGNLVLDGLTLEVRRGTVCGLLGPNGAGKTTVIRCVVGVQIVEGGTVTVLGEPAGSAALRRRVGYVTQAPSVYGDLTVAENLRYFARVLGAPPEHVERALSTVGMEAEAGMLVGRLSGGQRARVSLATALLGEPELIVLDEPTVGVDPLLRRDLWRTFAELASAGTTLLVSSHVLDEAAHCQELLLLRGGRLLAALTPEELSRRTGERELEAAFLRLVELGDEP